MLRSWKLIAFPLVIFIILSGELIRDIPVKGNSFDVEFGNPYRVLTFNSQSYETLFLTQLISDRKNDLICLQEVKLSDFSERIKRSRKNKWVGYSWYFGNYFDDEENGLVVLSKQPITLIKKIECPSQQASKNFSVF
ncbi:MAG: endonuclease/exonuclease/phosphatase family protein [Calditrichaeota bacterium]|nr:endonuclease/exonuclease/phosphatase family protein [Calditrichota bacterium]